MKTKILITLIISFLCVSSSLAETIEERESRKHEFGISISDWIIETGMWNNSKHGNYIGVGNDKSRFVEDVNHSYTPHFGFSYLYRLNRWFSIGFLLDYQRTKWDRVTYNNLNEEVGSTKEYFYNLSILPTGRFTYYHHPWVNIYTSLSFGMVINGGSETDYYGNHTAYGYGFNINWIGVSVGRGPWYGAFEIGSMFGLKNVQTIYMANCRIFTLSIGYRL